MKELSLCQSWLAKFDRFFGESRLATLPCRSTLEMSISRSSSSRSGRLKTRLRPMSSGPKDGREVDLLLRGQRLAAPNEHAVLVHRGIDGSHVRGSSGVRQVDAARLGDEDMMERLEMQGHGRLTPLRSWLR
jgi:hypothetical protein